MKRVSPRCRNGMLRESNAVHKKIEIKRAIDYKQICCSNLPAPGGGMNLAAVNENVLVSLTFRGRNYNKKQ